MTDVDGMAVTFVMNLAYMSIDKPEHYSAAEAQAVLDSYGEDGAMSEKSGSEAEEDDTQKEEVQDENDSQASFSRFGAGYAAEHSGHGAGADG